VQPAPSNVRRCVARRWLAGLLLTGCAGCGSAQSAPGPGPEPGTRPEAVVIRAPAGVARPPFTFAPDDDRLLDEIEHATFNYFWHAALPRTGMVPDRTSGTTVSVAGVGFQLSALPVGVERGWVGRAEAEQRALLILRSLEANPDNRKSGLFYHFVDGAHAGQPDKAYEHAVSTIDSALLLCGVITASSYFGGPVQEIADRLLSEADWSFFVARDGDPRVKGGPPAPHEVGFISLSWRPDDPARPSGEGKLSPYYWLDSGDEHRLVAFLAACAPAPEHRPPPAIYYRLRRQLGSYRDTGPMVWFPFSGALFTSFFAHCWINYAAMGPDDPGAHGVPRRARVDWWENGRRTARMHRLKASENPKGLPTFGPSAWGLTSSDSPRGYAVPGLYPRPIEMTGATPGFDYAVFKAVDDYGDGTVAPYGAGCTIMFDPAPALAALRHYRGMRRADGSPLVWDASGDRPGGGYGFHDSFNLGKDWVAPDFVAIDQGPLLLAIENARSGLVWRLFAAHAAVREGAARLGLIPGQ
jgi:hypothetical protein